MALCLQPKRTHTYPGAPHRKTLRTYTQYNTLIQERGEIGTSAHARRHYEKIFFFNTTFVCAKWQEKKSEGRSAKEIMMIIIIAEIKNENDDDGYCNILKQR